METLWGFERDDFHAAYGRLSLGFNNLQSRFEIADTY